MASTVSFLRTYIMYIFLHVLLFPPSVTIIIKILIKLIIIGLLSDNFNIKENDSKTLIIKINKQKTYTKITIFKNFTLYLSHIKIYVNI